MLSKIRKLYFPFFYTLILFNAFVSLFPLAFFWKYGFQVYGIYALSMLLKLIGYVLSIGVEKLLHSNRGYFFQNLGLPYRCLFAFLFLLDLFYLFIMLLVCGMVRAFI